MVLGTIYGTSKWRICGTKCNSESKLWKNNVGNQIPKYPATFLYGADWFRVRKNRPEITSRQLMIHSSPTGRKQNAGDMTTSLPLQRNSTVHHYIKFNLNQSNHKKCTGSPPTYKIQFKKKLINHQKRKCIGSLPDANFPSIMLLRVSLIL